MVRVTSIKFGRVTHNSTFLAPSTMAPTKWLRCEEDLIRSVFISPSARDILQASSKGTLKRVAGLITARYKEAFSRPFAAETTEEFAVRQAAEKRPHRRHLLIKRAAESDAECESRLEGVSTVRFLRHISLTASH